MRGSYRPDLGELQDNEDPHQHTEPRWDIDPSTGNAREWRLIANQDIDGQEWTFPAGKRLRGFKDLKHGNWCVYEPGDYFNSRIFGVPEHLLTIVRPTTKAHANRRHQK